MRTVGVATEFWTAKNDRGKRIVTPQCGLLLPHSLLPSTLVKCLAESGQSRLPSIPVLERFCVGPSPCREAALGLYLSLFGPLVDC